MIKIKEQKPYSMVTSLAHVAVYNIEAWEKILVEVGKAQSFNQWLNLYTYIHTYIQERGTLRSIRLGEINSIGRKPVDSYI